MASFLEKLKKGMDIEEESQETFPIDEDSEEEEASVSVEEIPASPLGPQEIIAEELTGNDGIHIESASTKSSKPLVKESKKKKAKKKTMKKTKESGQTLKIKDSVDFEEPRKTEETKWFESEGQLVVDVYETEDEIVIQSAIAGISPDDLDISIENDVVNIRGKREKTLEKHDRNYFYSECYWGYFSREIILPKEVDAEAAEASMKNGILTIRIPKAEKGNKKISVK
jgi:HSP20 family protein